MLISFVPFFFSRNDGKKIREKEGFRRAGFPPKKKKNCRKKRPMILCHQKGNYRGETRAQTHFFQSIKRATTLPLSTRYRDFLPPVLVLLYTFFRALYISRRLLFFARWRRRRWEARKPCLPLNERENRERIFSLPSLLFQTTMLFFLLFVSFFHPNKIFSFSKKIFSFRLMEKSKNALSPSFVVKVSFESFHQKQEKKNQKNETRSFSLHTEKPNHFFPITT